MPAILLVKTSSLGDVIHNLPIVADITRHVPQARIDWVVEEAFADIPALHPQIRHVIPVAMRRWRRRALDPATWREIADLRRRLTTEHYEPVLDTQGLLKSAVIARLANGLVAGQDARSAREPLAAWFYRRRYAIARGRHAVLRNRDLAAQTFGYALPDTPPDYGLRIPAGLQSVRSLPARYVVGLHGTSWPSKRWPESHWLELGRHLQDSGLPLLLPWGDAQERARAERLQAGLADSVSVVLPELRLRELASVIGQATAVIGVDTGLVHLAAALGRPTVAIYIDSFPHLTGLLPTDTTRAVSLGGKGAMPAVAEVTQALVHLGINDA